LRADTPYFRKFRPREFGFTYADLHEFRQVRAMSWQQIGNMYGCDHTTVMHAAKRLGVETARPLKGPTHDPEKRHIPPPKVRRSPDAY
jgi:hypothetical protein